MRRLIREPWAQAMLGWLLGGYMRLLAASVRWRHENLACVEPALAGGEGAVALFWHGRIPLILAVVPQWGRRKRPTALISPSADGEFIARAIASAGFPSIRASTAQPGDRAKARALAGALRASVAWVREGGVLIATPDGPRGPNEALAPGALQIARKAGAPVYLMGLAAAPSLRFDSWDRAMLPLPFGRGAVVWDGPLVVPADADEAATAELAAVWGRRLSEATRRAEALVRAQPERARRTSAAS